MVLKFLGTGGAFDVAFGSSAATVDLDLRLLVDCGPSIFPALLEKNLVGTLDAVLLTHLHGDHVGSLFQLAFFMNRSTGQRLRIAYPTARFRRETQILLRALGVPDTFYEQIPLHVLGGVEAIDTTGKHAPGLTSFAYVFRQGARTIFYSGDLGDIGVTEAFLADARGSDLLIFHEMTHARTPAHVHYSQLEPLLDRARIFAYHLDPRHIPADNKVPLVCNYPAFLW